MQDKYTGDIGDYAKYGLLRALSDGRKLGVAWYKFPDERKKPDGRHTAYLQRPDLWRARDPELFDTLKGIVESGRRKVAEIECPRILGDARFSGEELSCKESSYIKRCEWRSNWFAKVQRDLQGCDLVFADPDNGLCEDGKFKDGKKKYWKRIPLREAIALAEGRTAIIYHHNSRLKGGHKKEVSYWIELLGAETIALRWRAYSARTFFIINPTPDIHDTLGKFAKEWGEKADFHQL